MEKTISIIIPVYKVMEPPYFNYFSILIETINKNINNHSIQDRICDIIVVNDYPKENPKLVIFNLFNKYGLTNKLIYVQNPNNLGQAKSRNIGSSKAKGEYLHFIDQDDYVNESFYSSVLSFSEDIILSHIKIYGNTNKRIVSYYKKFLIHQLKAAKEIQQLRYLLVSNIAFSPGQFVVRRKLFNQVSGFPELKNKGTDDYGFLFNLTMQNNVTFRYTEEAVFYYRMYSTQSKRLLDMNASLCEFFNAKNDLTLFYNFIKFFKINKIGRFLGVVVMRIFFFKQVSSNVKN